MTGMTAWPGSIMVYAVRQLRCWTERILIMCRACQGHQVLSGVADESQGWVTAQLDHQGISCLALCGAPERHVGSGITRSEIMDYLSQTYGPAFVKELLKHVPPSGGDEQLESAPVDGQYPSVPAS